MLKSYNLYYSNMNIKIIFKGFFVLVIVFLLFFAINLFVTIKNKPLSAYTSLNIEQSRLMLQDTRVHNWDEIEKKN